MRHRRADGPESPENMERDTGFEREAGQETEESAAPTAHIPPEPAPSAGRNPESAAQSATSDGAPIDPLDAALVAALTAATAAGDLALTASIVAELRERRLSANGVVDLAAARAAKGGAR